MPYGVELLRQQNILIFDGLIQIALAEAESRAGDVDGPITILDKMLATSERIGHCTFEGELHRIRGDMVLKRNPANPMRGRRKRSKPPSGSRSCNVRAASNSAPLSRSPISTNRPAVPPRPTPSSPGLGPETELLIKPVAAAGGATFFSFTNCRVPVIGLQVFLTIREHGLSHRRRSPMVRIILSLCEDGRLVKF
jgi:hypothetical protein